MIPARDQPPIVNIHASCVAVDGRGLLLLGPSGHGKSDLALRLIAMGAALVADDRCEIWFEKDWLWCQPPAALAGKIEARGVGIVTKPWTAPVPLALAVRLAEQYDRMPPDHQVEELAGHLLPSVVLAAFEVSTPLKILLALDQLAPA